MMSFAKWITNTIWESDRYYPLKHVLRIIWRLVECILEDGFRERAQALSYTTILSIVPFFAVSFSVLKSFNVHQSLVPVIQSAFDTFAGDNNEYAKVFIEFVNNVQVGVLGATGFVVLFYTAVNLISTIEGAFNRIWHLEKGRKFLQRVSNYLVVILVGPVLLFAMISFFSGSLITQFFYKDFSAQVHELIGRGFTLTVLTIIIGIAYLFITNTKVKFIPALVGAFFAAILWHLSGVIFTRFIASSAQYSGIYSSFAGVILFLLWMYFTWLIILVGNQLAYLVQFPERLKESLFESPPAKTMTLMVTLETRDEYAEDWIVKRVKAKLKDSENGG